MRKFLLIIFIALFATCCLKAQDVKSKIYQISGVIRLENGMPSSFYKLLLRDIDKNLIIKTTSTDASGHFIISDLSEGHYYLTGDSSQKLGRLYKKINIIGDNAQINLGTILLTPDSLLLTEVKVKGYKNFIERKIDRLVVNIEGSPLAVGSNGLDIMKKLPTVVIEGGQIFVGGSNSVAILIDGKPASINNSDLNQVLKSLPSASIEKIEIVTNPPSAFDAQNDNIINIVLKKDRMVSNLTYSHDAQVFPSSSHFIPSIGNESISANLYATIDKLRISAVISNTYKYNNPGFASDQSLDQTPDYNRLGSTTPNQINDFFTTKISVGYDFSQRDILDAQIGMFAIPYTNTTNYDVNTFTNLKTGVDSIINVYSKYRSHSYQPSGYLSFTHYLNSKRTDFYSATATYGFSHYYPETIFLNDDKIKTLSQVEDYSTNVKSLKFDYKKSGKLSTSMGAKFTESENAQIISQSDAQSDNFKFNEKVVAEYVNVLGQSGKLSYQAGLRDEYTRSEGQTFSPGIIPIVDSYNDLYPSANLQLSFKNGSAITLSVTRRITRPNYENFNPYTLLTASPFITRSGDAYIQPLFTYKYELAYTWHNFTLSVNFQDRQNVRVVALDQLKGDTLQTQAVNINEKNFVSSLSYSKDLLPWWSFLVNTNYYFYNLYLLNNVTKHPSSFDAYLNEDFKLSAKSKAEVNFQYMSFSELDYLKVSGHSNVSASFITTFGHQSNFDLSLELDDILGTDKSNFIYNYITVINTNKPLLNNRTLSIGLTYRFKTSHKFISKSKRPDDFGEIRY